jgi:hypothetical protein
MNSYDGRGSTLGRIILSASQNPVEPRLEIPVPQRPLTTAVAKMLRQLYPAQ